MYINKEFSNECRINMFYHAQKFEKMQQKANKKQGA
jgi:hypothetical protein